MRPKIKFSQISILQLIVDEGNKTMEITFSDGENVKIEDSEKISGPSPAVNDNFEEGGDIISVLESYIHYLRTGQEYEEYQAYLDALHSGSLSVWP
jgi:hypothetical protein